MKYALRTKCSGVRFVSRRDGSTEFDSLAELIAAVAHNAAELGRESTSPSSVWLTEAHNLEVLEVREVPVE